MSTPADAVSSNRQSPTFRASLRTLQDSFSQWHSPISAIKQEYDLLASIPHVEPPLLESVIRKTTNSGHSCPLARQTKFPPCLGRLPVSLSKRKKEEGKQDNKSNKPTLATISCQDDRHSTFTDASSLSSSSNCDPHSHRRRWAICDVSLAGIGRYLHEFSITRFRLAVGQSELVEEQVSNTLVILHGYGAGLGFFCRNFEPLSRRPGWRVYALDLLGMGLSSRPPFRPSTHGRKDQAAKTVAAEAWFVDALEEWRRIRNLSSFTLLGHSMGGYLATIYSLKYPGRVNKLILASPVGFNHSDDSILPTCRTPPPFGAAAEEDESILMQRSDTVWTGCSFVSKQPSLSSTTWSSSTTKSDQKVGIRSADRLTRLLWEANFTPFDVVRMVGPAGPIVMAGWSSRRFDQLGDDGLSRLLRDYTYAIFRRPGSGEYALRHLLAPNAFARMPLLHRIDSLGWQPLPASDHQPPSLSHQPAHLSADQMSECGVPVVFFFGESDWVDSSGAVAACRRMQRLAENRRLSIESRDVEVGSMFDYCPAKLLTVQQAGHHLYLDNADEFNELVRVELADVEERQRTAEGRCTIPSSADLKCILGL